MNSSFFYGITCLDYIAVTALYALCLATGKKSVGRAASWILVFGFMAHTQAFLLRWFEAKTLFAGGLMMSVPVTGIFGSLMFFAWCCALICIYLSFRYKLHVHGFLIMSVAVSAVTAVYALGIPRVPVPTASELRTAWYPLSSALGIMTLSLIAAACVMSVSAIFAKGLKRSSLHYVAASFGAAYPLAFFLVLAVNFFYAMTHAGASDTYRPFYAVVMSFSTGGTVVSVLMFLFFWLFVWYLGFYFRNRADSLCRYTGRLGETAETLINAGLAFAALWTASVAFFGEASLGRYWSWKPDELCAIAVLALCVISVRLFRKSEDAGLTASTAAFIISLSLCAWLGLTGLASLTHI